MTVKEIIKCITEAIKCSLASSPNVASNIKVINKENIPSNKTQVLIKSNNWGIWVVGTLNQIFI